MEKADNNEMHTLLFSRRKAEKDAGIKIQSEKEIRVTL